MINNTDLQNSEYNSNTYTGSYHDCEDAEIYYVFMIKQMCVDSKNEAKICVGKCPLSETALMNSEQFHQNQKKGSDSKDVKVNNNTNKTGTRRSQNHKKTVNLEYKINTDQNRTGDTSKFKQSQVSWEVELIIGKFSLNKAKDFANKWNNISRGINSRRTRGLELFNSEKESNPELTCYDKRIVPIKPPLETWLRQSQLQEFVLPESQMQHLNRVIEEIRKSKESKLYTINLKIQNLPATVKS